MRNCKFLPHPKSLLQGEGLEFDFSSIADFQHHYSPSLAEGARGWVSSLQGCPLGSAWQSTTPPFHKIAPFRL